MEKKFRAWDKFQEKYVFEGFHVIGEITVFGGIDSVISETWKERKETYGYSGTIDAWDDFILEQFTGLKDKNKVDIYEGDIIQRHLENSVTTSVVVYCERHSALVWQRIEEYKKGMSDGNYDLLDKKTISSNIGFEIIGNVNKNPELLEC